VTKAALDADLGDAIAADLLNGPVADVAAFEAAFVAQVEASAATPELAWDHFYDATLRRVVRGWGRELPGTGTVATFTRIWSRAAALSRGPSVLDVGTCFGFFPLAWSSMAGAPRMLATDLSRASAALAARQARRLTAGVHVVCADGTRLPLADRAVASAHLLHVLEHVPAPVSEQLLLEALRVTDRRVVVAVPVEARPDPVFGHVQVFDLPRLAALGRRTGWHVSLVDADGAWLMLDRR
jgi:SAM-dependent methyltransferase